MKSYHCIRLVIIIWLLSCCIECSTKKKNLKDKKEKYKRPLNSKKKINEKKNIHKYLRQNEEGGGENQDGEETEPQGRLNTTFVKLNIFLDLLNFNYTFPNETFGEETKDIFIEAMNRAKNILETYLYYEIDYDFVNTISDNFFNTLEVEYYSEIVASAKLDYYNFFILFRFIEEDEDEPLASYEIAFDDGPTPVGGVIAINEIMQQNQYTNVDYLTNLMLHQFIHLLGFNHHTVYQSDLNSEMGSTIFTKEKFPNLFNYAEKYFNCSPIEEINIESDYDENVHNFHWPSRLLLGELMTNFDYPEEQILSGFTLAF